MSSAPATDQPSIRGTQGAGGMLLLVALAGTFVGTLVANLGVALVEYDESGTLGAACEHAEATIHGASGGLLVGLAGAALALLIRPREGSVVLTVLGGALGAVAGLLLFSFLVWPLATTYLPVFVCAY